MIEEGAPDEQLESRGLRFSPETSDEHTVVVHAAANSIAVRVIGIRVAHDLGVRNLGEKSCTKKRNRISSCADVGQRVGRGAAGFERELSLHPVFAARHDRVWVELIADQKEIPVMAGASAKDGLLMTAGAEREIELRAESI